MFISLMVMMVILRSLQQVQQEFRAQLSPAGRRYYTVAVKKMVVRYSMQPGGRGQGGEIGIRQTARDLVPRGDNAAQREREIENLRQQIMRWRKTFGSSLIRGRSAENRVQASLNRCTLHPGRPLAAGADFEAKIFAWVQERRAANASVTRLLVIQEALRQNPNFLGAQSDPNFMQRASRWYYRFKKRRRLVWRRVSSSGQKLPADWQQMLERNIQRFQTHIAEHDIQVRSPRCAYLFQHTSGAHAVAAMSTAARHLQYGPNPGVDGDAVELHTGTPRPSRSGQGRYGRQREEQVYCSAYVLRQRRQVAAVDHIQSGRRLLEASASKAGLQAWQEASASNERNSVV
jgi:hypothetical protein